MKYFLVYLLDYKNSDKIICQSIHTEKVDAIGAIEKHALAHVREYQGRQQEEICIQYNQTLDQLLIDPKIREGLYLKKNKDSIILYEKIQERVLGKLWNSSEMKINKVAMIDFTELQSFVITDTETPKENTTIKIHNIHHNNQLTNIITPPLILHGHKATLSTISNKQYTFLGELKSIFDNKKSGFDLKNIHKVPVKNLIN